MTFKNKTRQLKKKFPIKVNIFPIYVLCILSRIQTVNMDSIIKAVLVFVCFKSAHSNSQTTTNNQWDYLSSNYELYMLECILLLQYISGFRYNDLI